MYALVIVLLILLVFAIYSSHSRKTHHKKCGCSECHANELSYRTFMQTFPNEYAQDRSITNNVVNSMWDMEQNTDYRGVVPDLNQPDHVANFWKCDYSHANYIEGAGCLDTIFASDYPTPLRGSMVKQDVNSNMRTHIMSRFGAE
jgi:hypothetical protein